MVKEYQVTLICATGKYKPVSCIIKKDTEEIKTIGKTDFVKNIKQEGITKICQKRYWSNKELKEYEYTKVKVREYDKEKIARENAERYEKIKEEKYQTGEWKRPKDKTKTEPKA